MGSVGMGRALDSQPTAEMRVELEAAGFALPDADGLKELSTKMNQWLEQYRHDQGKDSSSTWFQLFSILDEDGSGYITFDEFRSVIRKTLREMLRFRGYIVEDDIHETSIDEFIRYLETIKSNEDLTMTARRRPEKGQKNYYLKVFFPKAVKVGVKVTIA